MVYCIIVVISPLKSKDEQVNYLNNIGVPAIAIGDIDDPNIIQQVMNGNYVVVYGFPECLLSTPTGRGIFADPECVREVRVVGAVGAHKWINLRIREGPKCQGCEGCTYVDEPAYA